MKPTTRSDISGNYTTEITTTLTVVGNPFLNNSSVEIIQGPVSPPNNPNSLAVLDSEVDFKINDRLIFTTTGNAQTFNVRCKITNILPPVTYTAPGTPLPVTINLPKRYVLEVIAFDIDIVNEFGIFDVKLEQEEPLFKFKFPRFATRYIYEDGEYSIFSPFTEVAFLPGEFDYGGPPGSISPANASSAGGGGAGSAGSSFTANAATPGGNGLDVSPSFPAPLGGSPAGFYAGGGGGGAFCTPSAPGGGGSGGVGTPPSTPGSTAGTANTGGGGGGGQGTFGWGNGANGGSGIVIIKYRFQN